MTIIELACAIFASDRVAVLITDTNLSLPGPIILFANDAFCSLVQRSASNVVGMTPRIMHGRETRRPTLDAFVQALSAGQRFHGVLTNYRANGEKYVAEIDCRPLRNANGTIECFIAFEREVTRRIGRPSSGLFGRYVPVSVSNDLLSAPLVAMGAFASAE